MSKKLITEENVISLIKDNSSVVIISKDTIITPLAMDLIRDKQLDILLDSEIELSDKPADIIEFGCVKGCEQYSKELEQICTSNKTVHNGELTFNRKYLLNNCFEATIDIAKKISLREIKKAVLIVNNGIKYSVVANKFPGVKAVNITDDFQAKIANDSINPNFILLSTLLTSYDNILHLLNTTLKLEYSQNSLTFEKQLQSLERLFYKD